MAEQDSDVAALMPPLQPQQPEQATPQARLEVLQRAGADRFDPVRWRYLEALARRIACAPPAVGAVLQGRWITACTALEQRCQQAPAPVLPPVPVPGAVAPLVALNQYIRQAAQQAHAAGGDGAAGEDSTELRSLRGFRETWSRIAAVDQVDAAVVRGPENAGPLNSHSLVLRSLALMRELSPDYLRRFLSQVETLMVLEEVAVRMREPAVAAPRARKARKKT